MCGRMPGARRMRFASCRPIKTADGASVEDGRFGKPGVRNAAIFQLSGRKGVGVLETGAGSPLRKCGGQKNVYVMLVMGAEDGEGNEDKRM
jgi:hypothetical protein